jgi:hypothetical protein
MYAVVERQPILKPTLFVFYLFNDFGGLFNKKLFFDQYIIIIFHPK